MDENHLSVLLIEDNPGDARLVREYLSEESQGLYALEVARSLLEATPRLTEAEFDAILLDLGRDGQGLEIFDKVHSLAPASPIVVLTELADETVGLEAIRRGAQEYLVKGSFGGGALRRVIRYAVGRMRSEKALRASEERFRLLAERSRDLIYRYRLTPTPVFEYLSPSVFAMTGYAPEDFYDDPSLIFKVVHPEEHPLALNFLRTGGAEGEPVAMRWFRKDGAMFWVEVKNAPIRDGTGKVVAAEGTARDITGRKRLEENLRKSEEKYRTIVEAASEGIWHVDAHERITYANPRMAAMLGYAPEEMVGRLPIDFLCDRSRKLHAAHVKQRRKGLSGHHEARLLRRDGTPLDVLISAVPLMDDQGRYAGRVSISLDITERKKAEEALAGSLAKLGETFRQTVKVLVSTIEQRDPYTAGHQRRTAALACAIAREMGLNEAEVSGIEMSAIVHDIGKIGVPAEILSSPRRLSETEFSLIKAHSQNGYDILRGIELPWPVADAVLQHHERLDGSGYPSGLCAPEIRREARILAVADVVEAMVSHRPYRPALGVGTALEEISTKSGVLYDPRAVQACLTLFTEKGFKFE